MSGKWLILKDFVRVGVKYLLVNKTKNSFINLLNYFFVLCISLAYKFYRKVQLILMYIKIARKSELKP